MLSAIAAMLLMTWLLGLVGPYAIVPFVDSLLVVGIVLFLVVLLKGRRALA